LPFGFDTREVLRAFFVFTFASLVLRNAQVPWWARPWLVACAVLPFLAAAPASETWLGALPTAQGSALWLAYAAICLSGTTPDRAWLWPRIASALTVAEGALGLAQAASGAVPTGTFGHPVFLGAFAAIGVIASAGMLVDTSATMRSRLALAGFAFGLAAVFLAGRRGPLLMLVVAFVGMAVISRARLHLGLTAVLACTVAAGLWRRSALGSAQETVDSRLRTFSAAWRAVLERPLFGHGPSRFADLAATWTPAGDLHYEGRLHNVLLLVAFSLGLAAAAALVIFAFGSFREAWKNAAAHRSGSVAAAAMVGPAYGAYLLTNVDQPGVGLMAVALFATSGAETPTRSKQPLLTLIAAAFILSGALPVIASLALDMCQRSGNELGCVIANTTESTGCLAQRVRAASVRKHDRAGSAQTRLTWMERCITRNDGDWLAHYQRALALYDSGQLKDATEAMTRVHKALPGLEEVQMSLSEMYAAAGRTRDAIDVLHAEQARPQMAGAMWRMRGHLLEEMGDLGSALQSYDRAHAADPSDAWVTQRIHTLRSE
jgi:tetratricopeptide (TPR) repeat protein